MKIINLTPHTITIVCGNDRIVVEPQKTPLRVPTISLHKGVVDIAGVEIPIVQQVFHETSDVPAERAGTIYIVSLVVLQAIKEQYPNRKDFYAPDTGSSAISNSSGQIVGVARLLQL